MIARLKRDLEAVGLKVDEVALGCVSGVKVPMRVEEMLTSLSPELQQAATLEPQACWTGTATGMVVS